MLAAERGAEVETTPPDANDGAVVEEEEEVEVVEEEGEEEGEPVSDAAGSLNLGKVEASKRGGDAWVEKEERGERETAFVRATEERK